MAAARGNIPNEVLLLDARLKSAQPNAFPDTTADEFFLISSIDTVLRQRGLSYQQIEEGITEGSDDGGIDAVYTFLNGNVVEDDDASVVAPADLELEIIQVKNESGFKEVALQKLIDHLPVLLQLGSSNKLEIEFNDRLLERFAIFRATYLKLASTFPALTIRVRYVTKAVDAPNSKVQAKISRLEDGIRQRFRDADPQVELIGAAELNGLARQRLTSVLQLKVAEGPLSAERGGFVCLVRLSDWHRFISDENGRLRDEIFEENVRGYEGDTVINKGIGESLSEGDASSADFWWLNNGVTVLGARVQTPSKKLVIEDPQIVNGLQTSRNIHQYFHANKEPLANGESRHLLVRVVEAQDDAVVSRIIKATNSQNRVSVASLRSTEPFQRQIEDYFLRKGYYYERKRNQYKNSGKPRSHIVEVLELAQAVSAIILREPHLSRGNPSRLVRDPRYAKVFNSSAPLSCYLNCFLIMRRVDEYLENGPRKLNRQERGNVRFQLARAATALALPSSRPQTKVVARVKPEAFDDDHLDLVLQWVLDARKAAEKAIGVSDINLLAKSAEWSREMDKRLSRYTDKMAWPKKITANWNVF